jgi:hypothetical protein
MQQSANCKDRSYLKQIGWFVLLWLIGVSGAMLLALPFRLLIAMVGAH